MIVKRIGCPNQPTFKRFVTFEPLDLSFCNELSTIFRIKETFSKYLCIKNFALKINKFFIIFTT